MSKLQLLNGGQPSNGADLPQGVSFDGSTDYLSRSSDLVGNVDSKTFTFSCWVYVADPLGYANIIGSTTNNIQFIISSNGIFKIYLRSDSTIYCNVSTDFNSFAVSGWNHIVCSFDMANSTGSKLYVNDKIVSLTKTTFVNVLIPFKQTNYYVSTRGFLDQKFKGRLSHLFLDYTYRDLSIEANRRLFITADGKPADGLANLNPILYLPMKDAATAHINEGTGGNFVQNGTLATADRGANQDNCVASYFDGVDDYLSSTGLSGATDSPYVLMSFITDRATMVYKCNQTAGAQTYRLHVQTSLNSGYREVWIYGYTSDNGTKAFHEIWRFSKDAYSGAYRQFSIMICIGSPEGRYSAAFMDGVVGTRISYQHLSNFRASEWLPTVSYDPYNNGYSTSNLGELYFDTKYIDLSTNNPFWDSETNKPIPVRKAMETLGSNPLICMPIDASNPTKNYGSGGDFTLNGGGLVGARGASEYIARSMQQSTSDYLSGAFTASDNKQLTAVLVLNSGVKTVDRWRYQNTAIFWQRFSTQPFSITTKNNVGTSVASIVLPDTLFSNDNEWHIIMFSFDTSNSSSRKVFVNGVLQSDTYWTVFDNDNIGWSVFTTSPLLIGQGYVGKYGMQYITNDYIDFSQEANRNLFVNQLGYPRDLAPLIADGTIPNPLIYLPFDDPDNLGKNLGTGGDFVVNGTVTAGADFSL